MRNALERCIAREQKKIDSDVSGYGHKYRNNRISAIRSFAKEVDDAAEKKVIYVCSPYAGDMFVNTENTKKYCRYVMEQGYVPFAPHIMFTSFLDDTDPVQRTQGCTLGLDMLERVDEMWVFGERISPGMKNEILFSEKFNIPVKYIRCKNED